MRRLCIGLASVLTLTCGAAASGQTVDPGVLPGDSLVVPASQSASEEYGTVTLPFAMPFVQYGAPQRLTAGLSVLVRIASPRREPGGYVTRGIELQGSVGQGGWRAAAGAFYAGFPVAPG